MQHDGDVEILCDTCGKRALLLSNYEYGKRASVSGFGLDECSACAKKRHIKDKKDSAAAEKLRKEKMLEFARWLKRHKIAAEDLRAAIPEDVLNEWFPRED